MVVLQKPTEPSQPVVHASESRIQGTAKSGGDLAKAPALVNALADHLTLHCRQLIEKALQPSGLVPLLGPVGGLGAAISHAYCLGKTNRSTNAPATPKQHGLMIGNGEQPATQVRGVNSLQFFE